jgi:hypothetical protein
MISTMYDFVLSFYFKHFIILEAVAKNKDSDNLTDTYKKPIS